MCRATSFLTCGRIRTLLFAIAFGAAFSGPQPARSEKAGSTQSARKQALDFYNQGNDKLSAGKNDEALRLFSKAIQLDPRNGNSFINRGVCHRNLRDHQSARADFTQAIRLASDSPLAYHNRADVHVVLGQYEKARADMEKAFNLYESPPAGAYLSRGRIHYRLGEDDKALADYGRALKKDPKDANVYNNRALIWQQKEDYKRALADLDAAARLNPKDPKPDYNRSRIYLAQGENDKAIAACTKALAIDPRYAQAFHNRGLAYQNKNEFEKALGDYGAALQFDPNSTQSYINRGIVFFRQRYLIQAIEDLTRAIELEPDNPSPYYQRGQCFAAQTKYKKAIADYSTAIELAPKLANAYRSRAEAYKALRKNELAAADFKKAKKLGTGQKRASPRRGSVARLGPPITAGEDKAVAPIEHPLQRSTGFVVARKNGQSVGRGTCWLLDEKRGWVVTNDHVVSGYSEFYVHFPQYDADGRMFTRTSHYVNKEGQIRATLVATDPRRDVALLQLATVPAGVPAIPLASKLPAAGEIVHSVGHSGISYRSLDSGTLWTYKRGKVADVMPFLVNIAGNYRFEAGVVRTASGTRPGDSGGPMVNQRGQLVGVVATGDKGEAVMTNAISVSELRKFLKDSGRKTSARKKTLVGVWRYTFPTEKGNSYLRYTFRADGTALEEGGRAILKGQYRVKGDTLTLAFPGYQSTIKISWETNDKFKAAFSNGPALFERW